MALPFLFGATAIGGLYGLDLYNLDSTMKLVVSLGAVLFGAYAPDIIVAPRTTAVRRGR